ncbi:MAG TPA: 4-hydroxy-tetrahydrodipicolinate reductase [Steroidobacteraceae bacterium]|jgi:4-hydroxy-tetrahydrodipicolinate reductase|nr:4-hydroxy-tetrahydrodipicolinate reductase [Steroidobacteraceae bacterium]
MTAAAAGARRTVIVGATGRMGGQLLRLIGQFPGLRLHGAVATEDSQFLGQDAGRYAGVEPCGIAISASLPPLLREAELILDFSHPSAAAANLAACVAARVALLIGTTGLPRELDAPLAAAADSIALLVAPNTSLGVNLLMELVRQAAQGLPPGYDIEIVETHHRAKRDAPSGTALALGAAAADGRAVSLSRQAVYARHGIGEPRQEDEIGFVSVRGGDVVGEHEVWFLGEGERVLLKHSATDRAVFARGALLAGQWLAGRMAGRYAMRDVFISKFK